MNFDKYMSGGLFSGGTWMHLIYDVGYGTYANMFTLGRWKKDSHTPNGGIYTGPRHYYAVVGGRA